MINNVVLVGRLIKDFDLCYIVSGLVVVIFIFVVNCNFMN